MTRITLRGKFLNAYGLFTGLCSDACAMDGSTCVLKHPVFTNLGEPLFRR